MVDFSDNVNDLSTKCSPLKSPGEESNVKGDKAIEESTTSDIELQFFNYLEFLKQPENSESAFPEKDPLVINHFPNTHVPMKSSLFERTRIIRIPRIFNTKPMSEFIPQFSDIVPGKEDAAIRRETYEEFKPAGTFDHNDFGTTSATPLVPNLLSPEDFKSIISQINQFLMDAFDPFAYQNILEGVLDTFSGSLFRVFCNGFFGGEYCKRKLLELENFIENDVNLRLGEITPDFKLISLRRTGYLTFVASIETIIYRIRYGFFNIPGDELLSSSRFCMFKYLPRSMNGIFAIEKPSGITSSKLVGDLQEIFTKSDVFQKDLTDARNNVIQNLSTDKKWTKEKIAKKAKQLKVKIGHGGTLDPLASGVLVIGVGSGTKQLKHYLGECAKTYETKALLGISTTTGDSEGEIITKNEIEHITKEMVKETASKFIGDLEQTPPIFSALKMNGKPLYDYAREGIPLPKPIKTRKVKIHGIEVYDDSLTLDHSFTKLESQLDETGKPKEHSLANNPSLNDSMLYFSDQFTQANKEKGDSKNIGNPRPLDQDKDLPEKLPLIHFAATVSSGTYIRSLVSDYGRALESSAYMVELIRSKQSEWELGKNVFTVDDFTKRNDRLWGMVLKRVFETGPEINLKEEFEKYEEQLAPFVEQEQKTLALYQDDSKEKRKIDLEPTEDLETENGIAKKRHLSDAEDEKTPAN